MCGQDPVEGFDLVKDTIHFYASFFHIPIIQNVIEFDLLASYDPPSDVSDITTSHAFLYLRQKKTVPQKGLITSTIRRDHSPKPNEREDVTQAPDPTQRSKLNRKSKFL
ncbi:MAG: hypothetical protein EBU00_11260 [Alphaproteobacteria bacterium]|nr:hypothetical protein [Alphaproteobacteria bacterium]